MGGILNVQGEKKKKNGVGKIRGWTDKLKTKPEQQKRNRRKKKKKEKKKKNGTAVQVQQQWKGLCGGRGGYLSSDSRQIMRPAVGGRRLRQDFPKQGGRRQKRWPK